MYSPTMPDDETEAETAEEPELTDEEKLAAAIEAVVFDDETEAALISVAGEQMILPTLLIRAVRKLVATGVLLCPPTGPLSPDAEARVKLGRFTDAMPQEDE